MSVIAGINYYLGLFLDTIRQFGRWRIWLLLLLYFLIDWLLLFAHYKFYSPVFYGFIELWSGAFGAQKAIGFTHYPGHFLLLPEVFGQAKFVLAILVEGSILGAIAAIFYRGFLNVESGPRSSTKHLLFLWLQLTLGWLLINGLVILVNLGLPAILKDQLRGAPRRIFAFRFIVQPFLYTLILAPLFYVIPYIAIFRVNVLTAVGQSWRIFRYNIFTTFFLAAAVLVVPVIFTLILGYQDIIITKFRPELIYGLLLAGLVADIFVNFFWMGTAARMIVDQE